MSDRKINGDLLARVVAAIAEIGRPATRGEIQHYGRRIGKIATPELEEVLDLAVERGLVAIDDRWELERSNGSRMIRRVRYRVVDGSTSLTAGGTAGD